MSEGDAGADASGRVHIWFDEFSSILWLLERSTFEL